MPAKPEHLLGSSHDMLSVTPFEHYMWADDHPAYPMVFYLKSFHPEPLDWGRWEQAVKQSLTTTPLLNSVLVGNKNQPTAGLRWQQTPQDRGDAIVAPATGSWTAPDLTEQPGVKVFLAEEGAGTTIYWQFHHACVDAKGGLSFVRKVCQVYNGQSKPDSAVPAGPRDFWDQHWTERRHYPFRLSRQEKTRRLGKDLKRIVAFQSHSFCSLRPSEKGSAHCKSVATLPALHHYSEVLSATATGQMKRICHRYQVTVNDLLLAGFFKGIFDCHGDLNGRYFRIAMPIDLRRQADAAGEIPANLVSMCFLDRKQSQCQDLKALLLGIRQETAQIKKDNMGLALCRVVGRLGQIPYALGTFLRPNTPFSSMVLSNLGRLSQAEWSQLGVERLELLPPIRYGNQLSVGCSTMGDRLTLSALYDPLYLTAADGQQLIRQVRLLLLDLAS